MTSTDVDATGTHTVRRTVAARRQSLQARRTRELTDLLATRPDLVGTYAVADFAAEGLRWTV